MQPDNLCRPRREVRHVAAQLPVAAKTNDLSLVDELLRQVADGREIKQLILLLARCADFRLVTTETGFIAVGTPKECHALYTRLRARGVEHSSIAAHIRAGENAYQIESRRARRERRNTNDAAA
jgi:hypothetical protein